MPGQLLPTDVHSSSHQQPDHKLSLETKIGSILVRSPVQLEAAAKEDIPGSNDDARKGMKNDDDDVLLLGRNSIQCDHCDQ